RQVGLVAVPPKRVPVQGEDAIEQALIHIAAEESFEADPALGNPATLAAHLLALLSREGAQIIIKARVVAIDPMKLAVTPEQPAGARAGAPRRVVQKKRM